jgi:threonine 3-dehydrogenase
MAASVVEFEGASSLTICEVGQGNLERAKKWAKHVKSNTPIYIHDPLNEPDLSNQIRTQTNGGVDVVLEMSGAPTAIQLGLNVLYPGGEMIQLGIPSQNDLVISEFTREFIFKGITWRGVLGRRMFGTWTEMLSLLERGLNLDHVVTHRMDLDSFEEGISLLDKGEALKIVLDI